MIKFTACNAIPDDQEQRRLLEDTVSELKEKYRTKACGIHKHEPWDVSVDIRRGVCTYHYKKQGECDFIRQLLDNDILFQ